MTDSKVKLFNYLKENPDKIDEVLAKPPEVQPFTSGAAMNTRTFTPKNPEARLAQYEQEREYREQALKKKLSFIDPAFDGIFELTKGFVLIGARPGRSKSTTVANIVASFLRQTKDQTALVISNEESSEAVLNRIACVNARVNFNAFHKGMVASRQREDVTHEVLKTIPRVKVVDDPAWDMTCLEDVQAVLEYAAKSNEGLVIIDYLQTVAFSREKRYLEPFQVSKLLGLYLKDYCKRINVPVIVMAQLKDTSETPDMASRVQGDRTIYNHAFDVIELVPDFKNRTTKFIFHKNRFSLQQGAELTMAFVDGRFEPMDQGL